MANDEWLRPATLADQTDASAWNMRPPAAAMFDLRPLSVGEILDRSFTLFRARFWLFAGLASISGAVHMVFQSLVLLVGHAVRLRVSALAGVGATSIGTYLAAIVFALASTVTLAASTWALAEIYLGRDASIAQSLRATVGRWYRYVLIGLWLSVNLLGAMMLGFIPGLIVLGIGKGASATLGGILMLIGVVAGLPVGFWLYLRNVMAIPVCVVEGSNIRTSLKRSQFLAQGVKWRLIVLGLVLFALLMVVSALQLPFTIPVLRAPTEEHVLAQAGILIVNLLGHILVAPIGAIGLTLFYFDQRVRKEGFDLLVMMGQGTTAVPAPVPAFASAAYQAPFTPPQFGVAQPMPPTYGAYPPQAYGPRPEYAPPAGYPPPAGYGGFPPAAPPAYGTPAADEAPPSPPAVPHPRMPHPQVQGASPSDAAPR